MTLQESNNRSATRRHASSSSRPQTILVVDDDKEVADSHAQLLRDLGYTAIVQTNPEKVESQISQLSDVALVLLDIRMPNLGGIELLHRIKLQRPEIGIIMATVINDIDHAVMATRSGAYNYLLKPLQVERLERAISSFLLNQPKRLVDDPRFNAFVTQSSLFEDIFRRVKAFAEADVPILIEGETGTGKELIAQIAHSISPRHSSRFLAVNVGAISPQLFESELFGHSRGAFTGAFRDKSGYIEEAADGTLFLDEIGELCMEQQKRLLRVVQNSAYCRVGDSQERHLKCRLIFATNRELKEEIRQNTFREDLYYRFASHTIKLPPLRSRPEDIDLLANYFLEKYRSQYGRAIEGFSSETMEILHHYPFPGNVRELDGYVSAAVLLEQSPFISPEALPDHVQSFGTPAGKDLESMRYQLIMKTLAECRGNQTKAADKLGIARGTLNRLLREYRLRETAD